MKLKTYRCQCCRNEFQAREADRKRGWARFCSKSCKAIRQVQRTGRGHPDDRRDYEREYGGTAQFDRRGNYIGFTMSQAELASGGYGDADWDTPFHDGKD